MLEVIGKVNWILLSGFVINRLSWDAFFYKNNYVIKVDDIYGVLIMC